MQRQRLAFAVVLVASACERTPLPTATSDPSLATAAAAPSGATLISETTWGGADFDVTEGAAVASDGSTYLVGFTASFGVGGDASKVFTVKFATDGSVAWERTWNAEGAGAFPFVMDQGRDAAVASDGSVYVVGSTFVDGNGALLLKFGPDGSLLWQRTWGGNGFANSVAVASDGSAYVTGATRSFGSGENDLFVIKLSPDGTLLWFKTWGSAAASEEGQGIAVGEDGNVYVAGVGLRPDDPFQFQFDAVVLKIDPVGTLIWQRQFPGGDVTDARGGIAVAADGSVYVGGGFQGPSGGGGFANDGLVIKVTSDGSLVWARQADVGFAEDIAVAADGSIVFVGSASAQGPGDAFVMRLSPSGKTLDASSWGGAGSDAGRGVAVAPDGTISLGAVAEQPPYTFAAVRGRASRARVSISTPGLALVDASGAVFDPGGVVATPAGSTTYAGNFDAALIRIAP